MDEQHNQQLPEGYEPGSDADIHIRSILFVGLIGAVLVIVIVLLLKALYYRTLNEERAVKQGRAVDLKLADLRTSQMEQLARYRWVDPRGGKVGIPIEHAMTLVIEDLAGRPFNGIEIANWDHAASDLQATPGNMLLLGRDGLAGAAPPLVDTGVVEPPVQHPADASLPNLSGTEDVPAEEIAETPALRLREGAVVTPDQGEDNLPGDDAAGGDH